MKSRLALSVLLVLVMMVGALPALAAGETLYARGGGVPLTTLSNTPPTSPSVKNYDWFRDSDPGVTIRRSSRGWQENDPKKYQDFVYDAEGLRLTGTPTLTVWSAVKDYDNDERGALSAHLLDCNRWLLDCQLVAETTKERDQWGAEDEWVEDSLTLPTVDHHFEDLHLLVLRITVPNAAEHNMWIAYDSTMTQTRLVANLGSPPPSTTTTTTAPPATTTSTVTTTSTTTTTTIAPPTTNGTVPTTTTTTAPPPAAPASSSTTTTETTTTTTAVGGSQPEEPPPSDATSTTTTIAGLVSPATSSTTTVPSPVSGPVDLERSELIVRNSEDTVDTVVAAPVRAAISPTRHLSVTFATIAETFRSNLFAALALGVLGAALGLTVIEKTAAANPSPSPGHHPTMFQRFQQCFTPLWTKLRSLTPR